MSTVCLIIAAVALAIAALDYFGAWKSKPPWGGSGE